MSTRTRSRAARSLPRTACEPCRRCTRLREVRAQAWPPGAVAAAAIAPGAAAKMATDSCAVCWMTCWSFFGGLKNCRGGLKSGLNLFVDCFCTQNFQSIHRSLSRAAFRSTNFLCWCGALGPVPQRSLAGTSGPRLGAPGPPGARAPASALGGPSPTA